MADIRIRLLSQAQMEGFNDAVKGLKEVEAAYGKTVTNTLGNTTKMKKVYADILKSGKDNAGQLASDFFQYWSKAMIYNFSGGDAAKLRSQIEKAVAEIVNIGGTGAFTDQQKQELQKALLEMAGFYDEISSTAESSSRRTVAAQQAEMKVLESMGDKMGVAKLRVDSLKSSMAELARQGKADTDEFRALNDQLDDAVRELNKANLAANAKKGLFNNTLGFGIKTIITGEVRKAIQFVSNTLRESAQVAAEAEQIYNKLATVFDTLADKAKRSASEIASSIGVAKSTASSALTTVGDLLQAQGMGVSQSLELAEDWVRQFYDIINFKDLNMTLDEFASTFMAGAAGNTRNFRTFGSIVKDSAVKAELMKQGLDKLTGSQLELAKMTTRANLALEQQRNAAGATKREWDTTLSVNRRLNEAWKEYRENLGTSINEVLKPMKSWWTDILTEINKANRAQKELQNGAKSMDVYDIYTNEKDAKTFNNTLNQIQASYSTGLKYANNPNYGNVAEDTFTQNAIQSLKDTMIMFTATVEDVRKVMGEALTDAIYAELEAWEKKNKADIEYEKAVTERTSSLEKAKTAYDDFTESLLGITGVSFNAEDASGLMHNTHSDSATQYVIDTILGWTANNISAALESLDSIDTDERLADVFGDVISGALDELDKGGLLESKIASYKSLFEQTWNEFLPDGFTEEEKGKLEDIKKSYIAATNELKEYNDEINRQTEALKGITSVYENSVGNIAERAAIRGFTAQGMGESEASLRYQWLNATEKAMSDFATADTNGDGFVEVNGKLLKLSEILAIIDKDYQEQIDLLEQANEEQRKGLADDALKSMQGVTADYLKQIDQFNLSDNAKAMDDLKRSYEAQISTLDLTDKEASDLEIEYNRQVKALEQLQRMQDAYNADLEQQARLAQMVNSTKSLATQVAQFGMTDEEKALDDLRRSFEDIISTLADESGIIDEDSEAFKELSDEYARQVALLAELQRLEKNRAEQLKVEADIEKAKKDREKLVAAYSTGGTYDYVTQLANFGRSSADIEHDRLVAERDALAAKHDPLWIAVDRQIEAFEKLQKRTEELAEAEKVAAGWSDLRGKVLGSTGVVGSAISTFTDDKGDIWSDILNVLFDILQKSEYWSGVVEILDSLVSPLLPIVEAISYTLVQLDPVFRVIAAILGSIAVVIVSVLGAINYVIDFFEWGWDWLKTAFHNLGEVIAHPLNASARDIRSLPNLSDYTKETSDQMAKFYSEIADAVYGIKKNTDKDVDTSAYDEMVAAGVITASEYDALMAKAYGNKYDRLNSYDGTSWKNGSGGTTVVYTGDFKFTIDGTNLSADEIAAAVMERQQSLARTGHYA